MSADLLIRAENVSKRFCRDLKTGLWYGVRDIASDLNMAVALRDRGAQLPECSEDISLRKDEFWANKDVCFDVRRGECLGLIGRNGAGKTTLLKMLNGLLKPDAGRIEMYGRVGALIALGAGFNPILTGRENIYINGAILGLSRKTVADRLEQIVEFAELAEFIDTPVRNYSSGMQVRLGFAIAAMLIKPDVLLLDEVLAVGDAGFRVRCLRLVNELMKQAAVVFVSHSAGEVGRVANRILELERGKPKTLTDDVSRALQDHCFAQSCDTQPARQWIDGAITFRGLKTDPPDQDGHVELRESNELSLRLRLHADKVVGPTFYYLTFFGMQVPLVTLSGEISDSWSGDVEISICAGHLPLTTGSYEAHLAIVSKELHYNLLRGVEFLRVMIRSDKWSPTSTSMDLKSICMQVG